MSDQNVQNFLGTSPGSTLLRLAVVSLIVGVLLAAFGFTPWGFLWFIRDSFEEIVGTGMDAVRKIAGFVASGALIVLPVWLIMKVLKGRNSPP